MSYTHTHTREFPALGPRVKGKSKDIDDQNLDTIENFNLSCSIRLSATQIRFYQTVGLFDKVTVSPIWH